MADAFLEPTISEQALTAVCTPHMGLANRIKCVLSAMRLGGSLRVYWPLDGVHLTAPFADLFETDFSRSTPPSQSELSAYSYYFKALERDSLPPSFGRDAGTWLTHSMKKLDGALLDYLYDRIPVPIQKEFFSLTDRLRPHPLIVAAVEEASRSFAERPVCVHIRTWYDSRQNSIVYSSRAYFDEMNRWVKDGHTIFVSSDSDSLVKRIVRTYPGRAFSLRSLLLKSGLSEGQLVFAEMLLLGKAPHLIASEGSTFTEISWLYSRGSTKVHVVRAGPLRSRAFLLYMRLKDAFSSSKFLNWPLMVAREVFIALAWVCDLVRPSRSRRH